ncbi:MAG: hypothetical protein WAL30_06345 [Candidatus Aquirickettsiella sp.]
MVLLPTKKQNINQIIFQLYCHYGNPARTSQNFFQKGLIRLGSKSFDRAMAIGRIRDKGILNLENFSLILKHPAPFEIATGLIQLHEAKLLNAENKKTLERHICPTGIVLVLRLLQSVRLLTEKNRAAIQEKKDPHRVASVLFKLYYADIFTQKNYDSVLRHPHLVTVDSLLQGFNRHNILTQTMFEQLIGSHQEKDCLSNDLNELGKLTILSKQTSNLPRYHCSVYASLFQPHTHKRDQSHTQAVEIYSPIYKN